MKILVLYHTAWIEAMLKSWQRSGKVEVAALPLPVVDWDRNPELKDKIAKLIIDYAAVWRPDIILDVNGAGVMSVPGESRWTPELAMTPWAEWWFDDPSTYVGARRTAGTLEPWLKALGCPLVRNFIWDATLAKEYSEWSGKEWRHLPTATDPELFSPESAETSAVKFPSVDLSFFGTFYKEPNLGDSPFAREINNASSLRITHPERNYFDIFAAKDMNFPLMSASFAKARRHLWGVFSEEILSIKNACNSKVGYLNRSAVLLDMDKLFPSRIFAGDGFPEKLNSIKDKLYLPSCLSACYRASGLALDLANGQSFSGTNMRVYEIMASGAVLACNRRPDFDVDGSLEGKAYFRFEKAEELTVILKKLKEKPAQRSSICAKARRVILEGHSWVHRLPAIMAVAS